MITILIDDKAQEIFWFLWRNRKEPYTIREIARETEVSYGSTWAILKEFDDLQLVYGIEKRRAHLYVLNFDHPLCFHVWSLLNALKRENVTDRKARETVNVARDGFIVQFRSNGREKTVCCSDNRVEGLQTISCDDFIRLCNENRDFYTTVQNTGIVLAGERAFYDMMWKLAEKKVIGVGG
ncbi:MAG: hypothetical protein HXS41_11860 [Theionarchaea archaeon]|nr:hypothetical protein [Theionarchaea archaeon]MBU7001289.1 hypothetical protein [Theionarchaea archaeon]MBU7021745.1 hypothetical protein [Theionarchaea archaeon]